MNSLNKLGVRVAGLTGVAVVLVYGLLWGGWQAWQAVTGPEPQEARAPQEQEEDKNAEVAGTVDSDGDGMPDQFEQMYQTDANSTDTDGDGVSDMDEVSLGRDPLAKDTDGAMKPETGSRVTNLDTYTNRYLASLPDDIAREEILKKDSLETYVEQNAGELLPALAPDSVKMTAASGKEAIGIYLDAISATHNKELTAVTSAQIEQAFLQQLAEPQKLKDIEGSLAKNVEILKNVAAPAEAVELHRQLLAVSQALLDNVKLLNSTGSDLVGGLIGAKKISDLGPVFQEIATKVSGLETKYELS